MEDKRPLKTIRIKQLLVYMLVVLLPVLITIPLLHLSLNTDLSHYQPIWSDEVDYWIQINAFREHGFTSGYFTINELTSNSKTSHYGTHGPVYPMMMGLLTRIFGWKETSAPLYNLGFICLALLLFLWMTKPDLKQCLYLMLILTFFYMLHLYIPTTMQESLHFALAIVYAGLFVKLFIQHDHHPSIYIALLALVFFASLLRIIWVVAAFPILYELFIFKKRSSSRLILAVGCMLLFSGLSAAFYLYWTSPYPAGNLYQLMQMGFNFKGIVTTVFGITVGNLQKLVSFSGVMIASDVSIRFTYLALILIFLWVARKKPTAALSILWVLFSTLTMTIVIYSIYNFRLLTTYLLVGLLVLIFLADKILIKNMMILYVIVGLLTRQQFVTDYQKLIGIHFSDAKIVWQETETGLDKAHYLPDSEPWCNSLLTTRRFTHDLLTLPAGIGTNIIFDLDEENFSPRSHYLLVSQDFLDRYNLDSKCSVLQRYDQDVLCERTDDGCN